MDSLNRFPPGKGPEGNIRSRNLLVRGARAAIYLRVSSEKQGKEGHSLEGQRKECRDYCDRHGYQVVRILQDVESGQTLKRLGLERMLALAGQGAFDVVVVWRRDRYGRDPMHNTLVDRQLHAYGVRVESTTIGPQQESPETELVTGMMDLIAQFDNRVRTARFRLGREQAAREGIWPARKIPGFEKDDEGRLIINPEQAALIREAYAECIRGANRKRLGGVLGLAPHAAVARIQSPAYKGEASWCGIKVPCPPIVDAETWQRANDAIAARYANKGGTHAVQRKWA